MRLMSIKSSKSKDKSNKFLSLQFEKLLQNITISQGESNS